MKITIAGIDPSSKKHAVCVYTVDENGNSDDARVYAVDGSKIESFSDRLTHLTTSVLEILKSEEVDFVFIEEPVVAGARNLRSTILIAQAAGAIRSLPFRVYAIPVSKWKKLTVGNGNASKMRVAHWLEQTHPQLSIEGCQGDQDRIDACCIAIAGGILLSDEDMGSSGPPPGVHS